MHTLQYLTCYPDLLCHKKAKYNSQHLKRIKKVHQSCPKTRTHFGFRFRTTLMKGFDQLQMLTTIYSHFICIPHVFFKGAVCSFFTTMHKNTICLQIFRKHAHTCFSEKQYYSRFFSFEICILFASGVLISIVLLLLTSALRHNEFQI